MQRLGRCSSVVLVLLLCGAPSRGQVPSPEQEMAGSIRGSIVDRTGTTVTAARVKLVSQNPALERETFSGEDGQFSFTDLLPGPFELTISAGGFATQSISGILHPGENYLAPPVVLALATAVTEVRVELSTVEIAQQQIEEQEKQRVLGFIPNFYVSYDPKAVPLNAKQKFELAWKTMVDPVTFGITGAIAGIQQAVDENEGYGQGAQGYAKRFGASYVDATTDTFIGSALLPILFKQDPRYFYKGTGSTRSRFFYAVANAVICKGDNGHWQANYSAILGSLASGAISNLYYPPSDRNGVALTFENTLIGIGSSAAANVLQEFLVRKLTPNLPSRAQAIP